MFQFFKKKSAPKREMAAVADGQVVPMNEATDPVFSSCALGGGVVIHPEGELIVAPDDGTITATMDGSNHAIGLELQSGVEVLVHIGVDTVQLNGEGFEIFVKNGDKVKKGDQLIHFDRKAMEDKGYCMEVMQIVMDGEQTAGINYQTGIAAKAGETIIATW